MDGDECRWKEETKWATKIISENEHKNISPALVPSANNNNSSEMVGLAVANSRNVNLSEQKKDFFISSQNILSEILASVCVLLIVISEIMFANTLEYYQQSPFGIPFDLHDRTRRLVSFAILFLGELAAGMAAHAVNCSRIDSISSLSDSNGSMNENNKNSNSNKNPRESWKTISTRSGLASGIVVKNSRNSLVQKVNSLRGSAIEKMNSFKEDMMFGHKVSSRFIHEHFNANHVWFVLILLFEITNTLTFFVFMQKVEN